MPFFESVAAITTIAAPPEPVNVRVSMLAALLRDIERIAHGRLLLRTKQQAAFLGTPYPRSFMANA
ncbi:MAG: hypothetical protein JOZ22_04545 [Acidobacteriia bacterium]|nr:hypothetical protein [Terriglobia bacterium]